MYFIDEEHKNNYYSLYTYYGQKGENDQYHSNIYLASVPDIYQLLELKTTETGPLIPLTEYDEEKKIRVPSAAGLTGSTSKLVRIGMSLFRGDPVDLDFLLGEEYSRIIIQALKIRYRLEH